MDTIISTIWRHSIKLKGRWGFIGKLSLGLFILVLSISYLAWRFPTIIVSGEKQIDTAVIAVTAIILLLPFLSEIELFGVKFKKEIEELEKDTNDKLRSLDQKLLSIQSQNINQYFYQPKTEEELRSLSQSVQETVQDLTKNKRVSYQVEPELVNLFTVKWKIRKAVAEMYKKLFMSEAPKGLWSIGKSLEHHLSISGEPSFRLSTPQIIELLINNSQIHKDIGEILQEMVAICDGAYFGRKVSPEQLAFVNENEYIIDYLENL